LSEPGLFEADPGQVERLLAMLEMLERDPASLSAVTEPERALETHVLDSLSGTVVDELDDADRVVDIGSGAGFPGIPLAVARPATHFDLVESVGRKADFMGRVIEQLGLDNATVVHLRSEQLAGSHGREAYDVVTARAVAPLAALAELASPLLRLRGVLVAWKGARDPDEEASLAAVSRQVSMELDRVVAVRPFAASRVRHLYVVRKTAATPAELPRRPGMARKRPLTG
jgi:16S rRNA (guanine527-N7)-methyltransferase